MKRPETKGKVLKSLKFRFQVNYNHLRIIFNHFSYFKLIYEKIKNHIIWFSFYKSFLNILRRGVSIYYITVDDYLPLFFFC